MYKVRDILASRQVAFNVLVCLSWASMLLAFMRGIINHMPGLGDYTATVELVLVCLLVLCALPTLLNRFSVYDYILLLLFPTVYLLNIVIYPDNAEAIAEYAFQILVSTFPFYFVGKVVDVEKFFKLFFNLSVVCVVLDVFYFLYYAQSAAHVAEMANGGYNMFAAYQILPHVLMLAWGTMKRFRIWKMAVLAIGMLLLVSFGARGPLACLAFFIAVYFIFFMKFKYSLLVKSVVALGGLILVFFMREIAVWLFELVGIIKMSPRIIEKFLSGDIGNDSGRGFLKDNLYGRLDSSDPLFGFGIFGSQRYGIIYPHDLPLDLFFTFGYLPGGVLLFGLFAMIIYAFVRTSRKTEREFLLLLVAAAVVKLFLSSSFIIEPLFFLLTGLCLQIILERRKHGE